MITKGIARLLEGMAQAKGATKAVSSKTQLRNAQSAKLFAQMSKKNYSDAFNKSRARINEMNMPAANKDDAVESLRTFYRNQHSEEMMRAANLGDLARQAPVTPVPDLVKQGLAFALGGGAGYAVGKNKEAITEMLKATKLPTGIDIETTSIGDLMGDSNSDYLLPYGALTKLGETLFKKGETETDPLFPEEELEEPSLGTKTGNLLIDVLSPIPRSWGE